MKNVRKRTDASKKKFLAVAAVLLLLCRVVVSNDRKEHQSIVPAPRTLVLMAAFSTPKMAAFCVGMLIVCSVLFLRNSNQKINTILQHQHEHHEASMGDQNFNGGKAFCCGTPMLMYMDGFHFSLLGRSATETETVQGRCQLQPCLTYFVRSWQLTESGKFKGAVVFSFLLAIVMEALTASRVVISRTFSKGNRQDSGLTQHCLLTGIYCFQALLGYAIMFLTMSFSIELLFAVVAGFMVGNRIFN